MPTGKCPKCSDGTRKQISIFFPLAEYVAIRNESARRKIPMTELCREMMQPQLDRMVEPRPS